MEERLICEAGMVWRWVSRRFEERINGMLDEGWTIVSIAETPSLIHLSMVARMRKEKPQNEDRGPVAEIEAKKQPPRTMHG